MARIARVVVTDCPNHVTQRGNRGAAVFLTPQDRRFYLKWLRFYSKRYGLAVWAYCLMTNHVHLIVVGTKPDSLAKAIGRTHLRYANWVNARNGWKGHLWTNRFFSTPMDEIHLWGAVKYVELNPVRAGIVKQASDYRWSSARAHCLGELNPVLDDRRPFPGPIGDWPRWLQLPESDGLIARVRERTKTGRPCGSDLFCRQLEERLGRRLALEVRGPKPKSDSKQSVPKTPVK